LGKKGGRCSKKKGEPRRFTRLSATAEGDAKIGRKPTIRESGPKLSTKKRKREGYRLNNKKEEEDAAVWRKLNPHLLVQNQEKKSLDQYLENLPILLRKGESSFTKRRGGDASWATREPRTPPGEEERGRAHSLGEAIIWLISEGEGMKKKKTSSALADLLACLRVITPSDSGRGS